MKNSLGKLVCPWPECIFRSLLQFLVSVIFPPGTVLITDSTTIYHLYTTPPCITVECWFTLADADLLNFTPENKYFDGVNPMI